MSGFLKCFGTPAIHLGEAAHGGRRPKTLKVIGLLFQEMGGSQTLSGHSARLVKSHARPDFPEWALNAICVDQGSLSYIRDHTKPATRKV
jgi:hypothetical protein